MSNHLRQEQQRVDSFEYDGKKKALRGALNQSFGELLEQTVLAEEVIGGLAVFQQFVKELWCNCHSLSFPKEKI